MAGSYFPLDDRPFRLRMGLRPLDLAEWLEPDEHAAEQQHPRAADMRQEAPQHLQPLPPKRPHHPRRPLIARAVPLEHQLPRLQHQPRRRPGDQLEAQRPRRLLCFAGAQRVEQVVDVDRRQVCAGPRQRRRRLHLQEAAQPRRRQRHAAIDRTAELLRPRRVDSQPRRLHPRRDPQRRVPAQPVEVIDEMDAVDFATVSEVIAGFLPQGPGPATGAAS